MIEKFLASIQDHEEYTVLVDALDKTLRQQALTDSEADRLLDVYESRMESVLGIKRSRYFALLGLVLDTAQAHDEASVRSAPLMRRLGQADQDALCALVALLQGRTVELARTAKDAAETDGVNIGMRFALSRAALDTLALQPDIVAYRDDIRDLANTLKGAKAEDFYPASRFLREVKEEWK